MRVSPSQENHKESSPEILLEWRVHLARHHPRKAFFTLLLILASGTLSALALGHFLLGGLTALVLLGFLLDFFLPVTYRLDQKGASARHWWVIGRISWRQVQRRCLVEGGIYLSPYKKPIWLEAYRGLLLRCTEEQRPQLMEIIKQCTPHLGEHKEGLQR